MGNPLTSLQEKTAIRIANLTKKFGDLVAVDGLSLEIYKGEIFGLLGPNGAGKTTTVNMICGLAPPTAGKIIFQPHHIPAKKIKTHIGICPQENVFWPKLTCYEQLLFTGRMYAIHGKALASRARELLLLMGLQEKAHTPAKNLSGGMKRRLNICLALIHDPEILILDEPQAGLDPQSRLLVRNFIKSLAQKKTVILTTHNMDEADRLADRVAIIDHGKLLLVDTPANLKKSIGEGDALEIVLSEERPPALHNVLQEFSRRFDKVRMQNATLLIHSKNLIESIAEITTGLDAAGATIKSVTLRENTLEDVFIHLTGRKLRQ